MSRTGKRAVLLPRLIIPNLLAQILLTLLLSSSAAATCPEEASSCSDVVFLRRANVILTGRLPSPEVLTGRNDAPLNRSKLVDQLLSSDHYGDAWGRWLSTVLGCEELPLSTAAFAMKVPRERVFWLWQRWTRDHLIKDTPYDEIVRELVASDSRAEFENHETYRDSYETFVGDLKDDFSSTAFLARQQNDLFWKTNRSPEQNAEFLARHLLGFRLECAKCHDHPYAEWTTSDHTAFCAVLQRTVYAELPLTQREKTRSLGIVGLIAISTFAILLLLSLWFFQNRPRLSRASYILGCVSLGGCVFTGMHFRHIFLQGVSGASVAPAHWLFEVTGGSVWVTLATFVLVFAVGTWLAIVLSRQKSLFVRLSGFTFVPGVVTAALVCVDSALLQAGITKQPFVMKVKSSLLHESRAQQSADFVREVYDDFNGNYERLGTPALLDGTPIAETSETRPRQILATWLTEEQGEQLDRSFVNRVALRVFGEAFVFPIDDFHEHITVRDEMFFQQLCDDFHENRSIKKLLKSMLLSDRFQTTFDDADRLSFQPRALRAEEMIASLNQLKGSAIRLNPRYSPTPLDPFSCGSEAPRFRELADRMINAGICAEGAIAAPAGLISLLMLDEHFQQQLNAVADHLQNDVGTDQAIDELCSWLWVTASDTEKRQLTSVAEADLPTAVWAIVNHPQFLIVP